MKNFPATKAPIDELTDWLAQLMMKSSEVRRLVNYTEEIELIERYHKIRFSSSEILEAYWKAGDYAVDEHIQNEHDTPQSATQRAKAIARWEAMRPSTARRNELRIRFENI